MDLLTDARNDVAHEIKDADTKTLSLYSLMKIIIAIGAVFSILYYSFGAIYNFSKVNEENTRNIKENVGVLTTLTQKQTLFDDKIQIHDKSIKEIQETNKQINNSLVEINTTLKFYQKTLDRVEKKLDTAK